MKGTSMQVKDRKVIGNSQQRFTKLHLSSVITYHDETTGSVNWRTAENVIYFQCHLADKLRWLGLKGWSVRWLDWLDFQGQQFED